MAHISICRPPPCLQLPEVEQVSQRLLCATSRRLYATPLHRYTPLPPFGFVRLGRKYYQLRYYEPVNSVIRPYLSRLRSRGRPTDSPDEWRWHSTSESNIPPAHYPISEARAASKRSMHQTHTK